jgi:DNA polymerase I-like protein with 3'-5' exonuclease and polymerase domains
MVEEKMRQKQLKSMIVNSVHDSIVIDTYPNEENEVKQCIFEVENNIRNNFLTKLGVDFDVPLIMECKIGENWMELEEYA